LVVTSDGPLEVLEWDWETLQVRPPVDFAGTIGLTVDVISDFTEDAVRTRSWEVQVDAVADAPLLQVQPASGYERTWIRLSVQTAITDDDRSESLELRVRGIPTGSHLTDGINLFVSESPSQWLSLTRWNLSNLAFMGMGLFDRNLDLVLEAITTESSNGDRFVQSAILSVDAAPQAFVNFSDPEIGVRRDEVTVERPVVVTTVSETSEVASMDYSGLVVMTEETAEAEKVSSESEEISNYSPARRSFELEDLVIDPVQSGKVASLDWDVEQLENQLLDLQGDVRFERVGDQAAAGDSLAFSEDLEQLEEVRRMSEEMAQQAGMTTRLGWFWGLMRSLGAVRDRFEIRERGLDLQEARSRGRRQS